MVKRGVILIFLLQTVLANAQYNSTIHTIDSLNTLLSKAQKSDTIRYELLMQAGLANQFVNPERTVASFAEALQLAKDLDDNKRIVSCLLTSSFVYKDIGKSVQSVEMLHEVIRYSEKEKGPAYIMAVAFIGLNFVEQGDLDHALEYTRRAYMLSEETFKDPSIPFDPVAYVTGPMKMGDVMERMGLLDSALYFANMSYQRVSEKPQPYFFCEVCNLLGNIHKKLHHPEMAGSFFRQALAKAIEVKFPSSIQASELALSSFYFSIDKIDSAIFFGQRAYENATAIKTFSVMKEAAATLRSAYERKGEYAKALKYNDLAVAARDSVTGAEKVREVQQLTYQEERRQQQIEQKAEKDRVAYRNQVKLYALVAVISVVLLIAAILFRNNRQKNKANSLLTAQKSEVQNALANLKATQVQLVQSEKMAALGQLTAGIAHEIQNPLNFVNNFSELNKELLIELDELVDQGNKGELKTIISGIIDNEEKISHHGKRAESIVKAMLQHSRSSSSVKELTPVNSLVEEYSRLAFLGLRAKDKSFNATLTTTLDPLVGSLNIIPQEIGRVVLNLLTNAFFEVNERRKLELGEFEPTVSVVTKKTKDKIEISIKDNGNGVPKDVLDKIFQPFFTTKPTGLGTGLGLSLSYEIIKAHGGDLTVETSYSGETSAIPSGATFTIALPG